MLKEGGGGEGGESAAVVAHEGRPAEGSKTSPALNHLTSQLDEGYRSIAMRLGSIDILIDDSHTGDIVIDDIVINYIVINEILIDDIDIIDIVIDDSNIDDIVIDDIFIDEIVIDEIDINEVDTLHPRPDLPLTCVVHHLAAPPQSRCDWLSSCLTGTADPRGAPKRRVLVDQAAHLSLA